MSELFKSSIFKSRYRFALLVIALMSLLAFLTMKLMLNSQDKYGAIINISGRQRMLSQRTALLLQKLHSPADESVSELENTLIETISKFEANHQTIINNDNGFILSPSMKEIYYRYGGVNDKFNAYLAFLINAVENSEYTPYPISNLNELLDILDNAVTSFEKESKELVQWSIYTEFCIFMATILLLLGEAYFIFRPLNKLLDNTIKSLIEEKEMAINARLIKSRFISNMTHEIRTPLNGIIGSIQLIKHEDNIEVDSEYLDIIDSCSKSTLELINSILDFEKIEANKLDINPEWVQIDTLLKDINYQFIVVSKQKEIEFKIENHLLNNSEIFIDPIRLKQILINLISNAFKFTDEGSVTLVFKYNNDQLNIEVIDTGLGIDEKDQQIIYDSFTQIYQNSKNKVQGTGLGLNIVRNIIKLMGGELFLNSKVGKGSTFSVNLPTKRQVKTPERIDRTEIITSSDTTISKHALNVLVLEDNSINSIIIKKYLDNLGHRYVLVENGEEGLKQIKQNQFDFILCDIQMPVMNGVEFLKYANELDLLKEAKIFAFTANALKADINYYEELGFHGTIQKPVTIFDLKKILEA